MIPSKKILVIEDDKRLVTIMSDQLEYLGYEVCLAYDGLEGLKLVEETRPDLIVLDIMLPGLDGYEICSKIKSIESSKQIPVLMLTSKGKDDDFIRGYKTGADDFLTKPYDQYELAGRIEILIERQSYISTLKQRKKVFISYAMEDLEIVNALRLFLKTQDVDLWFDKKKLLPGQKWKREIKKAIAASDIFIVCLSTNSITKRGYVHKELKEAFKVQATLPDNSIYVIPIRLNECDVPDKLRHLHCEDFFSEEGRSKLVQAIYGALVK
ncbi:MAG: response regulator [Calditrichia bacterium]